MKSIYSIWFLLFWFVGFAQPNNDFIKHTVVKGETITQIARKYQVTPYDIFRLNPDAKSNLAIDSILIIPLVNQTSKVEANSKNDFFEYEVKSKETLYGISKKFNVSIVSIEKSNPEIFSTRGLNPGDLIKIPNVKNAYQVETLTNTSDTLFHLVKEKETPYSVAKRYGISVKDLYDLNPNAERNFNIDDKIIIRINHNVSSVMLPVVEIQPIKKDQYIVQPQENLHRLSMKFRCSEQELLVLNPQLKNGLKAGDTIFTPNLNLFSFERRASSDLTKTLNIYKKTKDLVLMIPFNLKKIESDSITKLQERFKKDLFLNMSLDFYSGALMAIDSAKSLGINMKVKIYDSEETNNSCGVSSIINNNDFSNVGAIIGPFYPQHNVQVAQLVSSQNIPVFSPLRELNTQLPNSYQTVLKTTFLRDFMYQYIARKQQNILAAIDNSKGDINYFLSQKPEVKLLKKDSKGFVLIDSLVVHLKKDQTNYVILDAKKTGFILNIVESLTNLSDSYDIKLVTLEKNESLDFEEIKVNNLAKLSLMYPSQIQDTNLEELDKFSSKYKKKYNDIPSFFAIRGFDLTLDIILRLAQNEQFLENISGVVSEQIFSKFDYTKSDSSLENQGAYILQYQEDLTIKTIDDYILKIN